MNTFESILNVAIAFISFSLIASAVYIFNDYCDIDSDRVHSIKKYRPLASGQISVRLALSYAFLLLTMSFIITSLFLSLKVIIILICYLILNLGYSYYLKKIALLDVTIIAIGFVLRLFIGGVVSLIELSNWIVVMTFLLSLFLSLAKRRDDMIYFLKTNKKAREVIDGYSLQLIDTYMIVSASVTIVSYVLYTNSMDALGNLENQYLYLTSFFVILGVMRYFQLAFVEEKSGSPIRVLFL